MDQAFNTQSLIENFLNQSISYNNYWAAMLHEKDAKEQYNSEHPYSPYIALNVARTERVTKTLVLNQNLIETLKGIDKPQTWLVITEIWCGDSAQNLPALNAIAEASEGKIKLKICYRDVDTTLIDAFLTNGARSIPKLIALNESNDVLFTWGPRPNAAQELVMSLKSNPETKDQYAEHLHIWYARNKCADLQDEINNLLGNL